MDVDYGSLSYEVFLCSRGCSGLILSSFYSVMGCFMAFFGYRMIIGGIKFTAVKLGYELFLRRVCEVNRVLAVMPEECEVR